MRRSIMVSGGVAIVAAAVFVGVAPASAHPADERPGHARMHAAMVSESPEMARMHARMVSQSPEMARMHAGTVSGRDLP